MQPRIKGRTPGTMKEITRDREPDIRKRTVIKVRLMGASERSPNLPLIPMCQFKRNSRKGGNGSGGGDSNEDPQKNNRDEEKKITKVSEELLTQSLCAKLTDSKGRNVNGKGKVKRQIGKSNKPCNAL